MKLNLHFYYLFSFMMVLKSKQVLSDQPQSVGNQQNDSIMSDSEPTKYERHLSKCAAELREKRDDQDDLYKDEEKSDPASVLDDKDREDGNEDMIDKNFLLKILGESDVTKDDKDPLTNETILNENARSNKTFNLDDYDYYYDLMKSQAAIEPNTFISYYYSTFRQKDKVEQNKTNNKTVHLTNKTNVENSTVLFNLTRNETDPMGEFMEHYYKTFKQNENQLKYYDSSAMNNVYHYYSGKKEIKTNKIRNALFDSLKMNYFFNSQKVVTSTAKTVLDSLNEADESSQEFHLKNEFFSDDSNETNTSNEELFQVIGLDLDDLELKKRKSSDLVHLIKSSLLSNNSNLMNLTNQTVNVTVLTSSLLNVLNSPIDLNVSKQDENLSQNKTNSTTRRTNVINFGYFKVPFRDTDQNEPSNNNGDQQNNEKNESNDDFSDDYNKDDYQYDDNDNNSDDSNNNDSNYDDTNDDGNNDDNSNYNDYDDDQQEKDYEDDYYYDYDPSDDIGDDIDDDQNYNHFDYSNDKEDDGQTDDAYDEDNYTYNYQEENDVPTNYDEPSWGNSRVNPCLKYYSTGRNHFKTNQNNGVNTFLRWKTHLHFKLDQNDHNQVRCIRKPNWRRFRPLILSAESKF